MVIKETQVTTEKAILALQENCEDPIEAIFSLMSDIYI